MAKRFLLGFDVGGTKVEVTVLVESESSAETLSVFANDGSRLFFESIYRERVPTHREKGYQSIVDRVTELASRALLKTQLCASDLYGVGVGLPGTIHPQTQIMISGNTTAIIGKNFAEDLKSQLKWANKFFSANDANCFTLSEVMCGVGKQFAIKKEKPFNQLLGIGIILGTGCGGGVVSRGKILSGTNGGAAEFGHTILYRDGLSCYCGRQGCAEQYLSGTAIETSFAAQNSASQAKKTSAKEVFRLAENGELTAVEVVKEYQRNLAYFLGNLTAAFDPDFFVLGGGVSQQDSIYLGLEKLIIENTFLPLKEVNVYKSQLGDSSGVIGAALLPLLDEMDV